MIYFYQNLAYNNLDLSQLLDYPFWLAQYTDFPTFYYDFEMWQYTSSGRVAGIAGDVDLNLRFFRDGQLPPSNTDAPAEEEQDSDQPMEEDTQPSQDVPQDLEEEEKPTEEGEEPADEDQEEAPVSQDIRNP